MTTTPVTKDTAPPAMLKLALAWLYDNDLPAEWEDAVALEFDAAIEDRKLEIVSTHKEGRPADVLVVDWQSHAPVLIPAEDAPEAAAGDEHRW